MARSDELRARARAIQTRDHPAELERPAAAAPEPDGKPVRQTVDITRTEHNAFAMKRMETSLALGRPRLTAQDALAALIAEYVEGDGTVARRVQARLERDT